MRWLLAHRAGLAAVKSLLPGEALYDWDAMTAALAQDLGPRVKKLADGVYVHTGNGFDSNSGIILTDEGVVVIDTGQNPIESLDIMATVKKRVAAPRWPIRRPTRPKSPRSAGPGPVCRATTGRWWTPAAACGRSTGTGRTSNLHRA